MPSKNQTVMKVNKSTLETIRKIAEIEKTSPPKVVDLAIEILVHEYPQIIEKDWSDVGK